MPSFKKLSVLTLNRGWKFGGCGFNGLDTPGATCPEKKDTYESQLQEQSLKLNPQTNIEK